MQLAYNAGIHNPFGLIFPQIRHLDNKISPNGAMRLALQKAIITNAKLIFQNVSPTFQSDPRTMSDGRARVLK